MSLHYNSIKKGKRQKCKEMHSNLQVYTSWNGRKCAFYFSYFSKTPNSW